MSGTWVPPTFPIITVEFKVGDEVRTPKGDGTVTEVHDYRPNGAGVFYTVNGELVSWRDVTSGI